MTRPHFPLIVEVGSSQLVIVLVLLVVIVLRVPIRVPPACPPARIHACPARYDDKISFTPSLVGYRCDGGVADT